jgi:hypothetical protein
MFAPLRPSDEPVILEDAAMFIRALALPPGDSQAISDGLFDISMFFAQRILLRSQTVEGYIAIGLACGGEYTFWSARRTVPIARNHSGYLARQLPPLPLGTPISNPRTDAANELSINLHALREMVDDTLDPLLDMRSVLAQPREEELRVTPLTSDANVIDLEQRHRARNARGPDPASGIRRLICDTCLFVLIVLFVGFESIVGLIRSSRVRAKRAMANRDLGRFPRELARLIRDFE